MLTVGVDLAAQPEGTAIAYLEWSAGRASLRGLVVGANDDQIVEAVRQADKVGIDCPLGCHGRQVRSGSVGDVAFDQPDLVDVRERQIGRGG